MGTCFGFCRKLPLLGCNEYVLLVEPGDHFLMIKEYTGGGKSDSASKGGVTGKHG